MVSASFRSLDGTVEHNGVPVDAERTAVAEYLQHDHGERNHQGLHHQVVDPGDEVATTGGEIQCRGRLGGLSKYFYSVTA